MEVSGSEYLFNLSLLAVTFAAVSALVMLLRQTMGGQLSNFDVYLIATYVSLGFVVAVAANLPLLVSLFDLTPELSCTIGSALAAGLFASVMVSVISHRRQASTEPMSTAVVLAFTAHCGVVLLLAINAVFPAVQGIGLFAASLTLSLAVVMWSFVRRIASLLGEKPGDDWDPKRG